MSHNNPVFLRYLKLSSKAHSPYKGSINSAGYDLESAYDYIVPAQGKMILSTDIQFDFPKGCYGRIAPCSSLSWNHHIQVGGGVIDADYLGNVKVILFNHSHVDFIINAGDRIAQIICEKLYYPKLEEISCIIHYNHTKEEEDMKNEEVRGDQGFGPSDKK